MRRRDLSSERDEFHRRYFDRGVHFWITPEYLTAALERGLGLNDDVQIVDWTRDAVTRGWVVSVIGPQFPIVPEGEPSKQVQLIHQQTRFEG